MTRSERLALAAAACLAAALGCATAPDAKDPAAAPTRLGPQKAFAVANGYTAGALGFRHRKWDEAADGYVRASSFDPTDDGAAYLAAVAYARAGNAPAALEWLDRLWRLNSCLAPLPKSFTNVASDQRFRDVAALIRAQVPKTHPSTVAFTLGARDLLPGGLAWDPAGRAYYVASLRKRKILRVTPGARGGPASAEEFAPKTAGGLDAVLGVAVDPERRRLWAVTGTDPAMEGFRPEESPRTALVAFDLASGRETGRWSPMTKPPHLFGGLALDAAGSVWVTDSASGEMHVLRPGAPELVAVVPAGTFLVPKGVAVSPDGTRVYVSDLARGVYRVDRATGEATVLDQPAGPWPAALETLVLHRGALVGIAGTVSFGRVARWTLAPDGSAVDRVEVLDCAHPAFRVPAAGTAAGDALVYVANTQVDALDEKGALPPADRLEDLVFLTLPLGR